MQHFGEPNGTQSNPGGYAYPAPSQQGPPPVPVGNPYASSTPQPAWGQPAQPVTPQQFWQMLGYMSEPTFIDTLNDIVGAQNDTARFMVSGGMSALMDIIGYVIETKMCQFYRDFDLVITRLEGEGKDQTIRPHPEQSTEYGKELMMRTTDNLSAKLTEISNAMRAALVAPGEARIGMHQQAANLVAQRDGMSAFAEEIMGEQNQKGGVGTAVGGFISNTMRMAAGLPPRQATHGSPPPVP